MMYPNLFKQKYGKLSGRSWIKSIEPDDVRVFVRIGMEHHNYGKMGGCKRAKTAKRDEKGRFSK